MRYPFNSNVLRRDVDEFPMEYPFNSNVLKVDKKTKMWWEKHSGPAKKRSLWETFRTPVAAWDFIPKKQKAQLRKKLTIGTAFKPIPEKDKKAISRAIGTNRFIGVKNPFQSLEELTAMNIMRGVKNELVPEAPDDRYVKLRSGPFKGQWKKVHEEVTLWKESFYKFVTSSMMSAVAYNPERREMEIEFVGGAVYRYRNIPKSLWEGLMNAPSHGKYFWKHIRRFVTQYPFKRVRFMRKEDVPLPKGLKEKGYKT